MFEMLVREHHVGTGVAISAVMQERLGERRRRAAISERTQVRFIGQEHISRRIRSGASAAHHHERIAHSVAHSAAHGPVLSNGQQAVRAIVRAEAIGAAALRHQTERAG